MSNQQGNKMKKRKPTPAIDELALRNPVAKFAHHFNKAQIFADKNRYHRAAKHKKQEAFAIALNCPIAKASFISRNQRAI